MNKYLILNPILFVLLILFCHSTPTVAETGHPVSAKENWEKWTLEREKRMGSPDGWMSLAGLYWLNEGNNTIGSDKNNQQRFPKKTPAFIGNVVVKGDTVTIEVKDPKVLVNGQKTIFARLSVKDRTRVTFGSFTFFIIKREKGYAIRLRDNQNPALKTFQGLDFYPYNPEWVKSARLIKNQKPKKLMIQTVYGTFRHEKSAGWIEFSHNGETYRLQAVDSGPKEPLFIMFTDGTSEKETYGAGRYIDIPRADDNGNTVIDFNYAYNPPCAFTHFATCPLPPRSNKLKIEIKAGEKYSGHH